MTDPRSSTTATAPAPRPKEIAELLAPYSVTKPESGQSVEDPVVGH